MDLRAFQLAHGLTLSQLAVFLGINKTTLHRYLRGTRVPDARMMVRIIERTRGEVEPNDFYPRVAYYRSRRRQAA